MAGDASSDRRVEPVLDGTGMRIAVVAGRFNDRITFRLLDGVERGLTGPRRRAAGGRVGPGRVRDPAGGQGHRHDRQGRRGDRPRLRDPRRDHPLRGGRGRVARRASCGPGSTPGCRSIFGVLTTEDLDQALERSEDAGGHNVGEEGAATAVEMVQLLRRVRG